MSEIKLELRERNEAIAMAYTKGYQQGRAEAIDDVERELLRNGFIATHHALEVWHEIAEQLKEQTNERI